MPIRGPKGDVIAHVFPGQAEIYNRMMREADEQEAAEKAARERKRQERRQQPIALQAASFKAGQQSEPKPAKSGHPGQPAPKNALIDRICADVVREQSAKR